jgi:hypothetical protein
MRKKMVTPAKTGMQVFDFAGLGFLPTRWPGINQPSAHLLGKR